MADITVTFEGNDTRTRRRRLAADLHPDARNPRWFRDAETGYGQFAVARNGGRVVGYVNWYVSRTRGFQPSLVVNGLYGTPGVGGVGTALMAHAASQAQQIGAALSVQGAVQSAKSFYERVGGSASANSSIVTYSDAARDALAARSGTRNAAAPAAAATGNS